MQCPGWLIVILTSRYSLSCVFYCHTESELTRVTHRLWWWWWCVTSSLGHKVHWNFCFVPFWIFCSEGHKLPCYEDIQSFLGKAHVPMTSNNLPLMWESPLGNRSFIPSQVFRWKEPPPTSDADFMNRQTKLFLNLWSLYIVRNNKCKLLFWNMFWGHLLHSHR